MLNKGILQADLAMLDSANDNAFNNPPVTTIVNVNKLDISNSEWYVSI